MLAADQPFVQLAEQPEGLFAHLGKRRRRKGDWTADQDRQLILQFWRHLIDPAKWPAKDITVDEGLRHGEAVKMRLKTLRRDPYFAALLPTTAPPFLATYRDLCDVILDPARLAAFRTRAGASADPAPAVVEREIGGRPADRPDRVRVRDLGAVGARVTLRGARDRGPRQGHAAADAVPEEAPRASGGRAALRSLPRRRPRALERRLPLHAPFERRRSEDEAEEVPERQVRDAEFHPGTDAPNSAPGTAG